MSKKYRPTNEEMNDLDTIVSDTLDKLCKMADRHNIDRNELVNYYANVITGIAEFANIRNCETNHTNADRIRNMSDEELAELITDTDFECADYCDSFAPGCGLNCDKENKEVALKWLQSESEATKDNKPTNGYYSLNEALDMALQALEKQIPKKPTYEGDGYAPDGTFIYDTWICPCCDKRYEVDYDDYDYCPNCGQKLDWSNEV